MTADDMVTVPRELAERLRRLAVDGEHEDPTAHIALDAILNPPPEFDPAAVEALAARRYQALGDDWGDCFVSERSGWLASAREDLTALRAAGWEMVETVELEALRWLANGGGADWLTSGERDAIRKAKEAQ